MKRHAERLMAAGITFVWYVHRPLKGFAIDLGSTSGTHDGSLHTLPDQVAAGMPFKTAVHLRRLCRTELLVNLHLTWIALPCRSEDGWLLRVCVPTLSLCCHISGIIGTYFTLISLGATSVVADLLRLH